MNTEIQTIFNGVANTYDQHCFLQKRTCITLISFLKKIRNNFQNIVDFGCGTGISTGLLKTHFQYNYLCGIDFATELLEKARINLKDDTIDLFYGDFNENFFPEQVIDLAFANMALHWGMDIGETFLTLAKQIRNNSLLAFSLPIAGTFSEVSQHHRNNFKKSAEIIHALDEANFKVIIIAHDKFNYHFNSWRLALQSIKLVGANYIARPEKKYGLSSLTDVITKKLNDPQLTYNIAYVIAKRSLFQCKMSLKVRCDSNAR